MISITILLSSLYFVRSGYIVISNSRLASAGSNGYGWSSSAAAYTSIMSSTAYHLGFNAANIYTSAGPRGHWYGFPLYASASWQAVAEA